MCVWYDRLSLLSPFAVFVLDCDPFQVKVTLTFNRVCVTHSTLFANKCRSQFANIDRTNKNINLINERWLGKK